MRPQAEGITRKAPREVGPTVSIGVKDLRNGETIRVDAHGEMTFLEMKQLISERQQSWRYKVYVPPMQPSQMQLAHSGKPFRDDCTLDDANLNKESTLHLLPKGAVRKAGESARAAQQNEEEEDMGNGRVGSSTFAATPSGARLRKAPIDGTAT